MNTLKWTHIATYSYITLQSFFVKIAYNNFSSANGHISEVITHTHRSSFIVLMKRERMRDKKVSKWSLSYVAHVPLDKGVYVCVQFPFIAYLTHITGCLSASVQSKKIRNCWLLSNFNILYQYDFSCCHFSLTH